MRQTQTEEGFPSSPLVTIADASRLLNVHPNTLRRWCKMGLLKTHRIGTRGDRRFARDDLEAMLRETTNA